MENTKLKGRFPTILPKSTRSSKDIKKLSTSIIQALNGKDSCESMKNKIVKSVHLNISMRLRIHFKMYQFNVVSLLGILVKSNVHLNVPTHRNISKFTMKVQFQT